ncbi:MAG: BON domain-containing protein [Burkholderiaceae bacterium]|nr:BON domain-containing protein [Burkholderiaceae bacterium]
MNIRNITLLVGALSAAFALAGCNRQEQPQTTGQKVDAAIETSKDKMEDAKQATGDALKATGTAIGDSAITASVKASLAADTELKMLDISVETTSGRAVLKGSAPNATARDRATQIAKAVDGVTGVDNLLEVKP